MDLCPGSDIGMMIGIGLGTEPGTVSGTVFNIAPVLKTRNLFFGFFRRFDVCNKIHLPNLYRFTISISISDAKAEKEEGKLCQI